MPFRLILAVHMLLGNAMYSFVFDTPAITVCRSACKTHNDV